MMENPLDIVKRLDIKHNVTIRVIDEPTGKVVQEHIGHNAATNSLLTGIAHYLMGDGVLNQAGDILSSWIPQYISLGTMGLTSQDTGIIDDESDYMPIGIGYTPIAPDSATEEEKQLNEQLRFEEYINQSPGFGADGYDAYTNNNREWFGLGKPYSNKPAALVQDFYNKSDSFILTHTPITNDTSSIVSITAYPDGVINQDIHDTSIVRTVISVDNYTMQYSDNQYQIIIDSDIINSLPEDSRLAIIYAVESTDAANCELINANTLRSKITYRSMIPEVQSEIPNTIDIIYSAFVSTGALKEFRGDNDYIFITEAGLWSKSSWNNSGDNGLLAGYRIMPADDNSTGVEAEQTFTGDGVTTSFEFNQSAIAITFVAIDGEAQPSDSYTFSDNQIVFTEAPAEHTTISVVYTIPSWKDMSKPENREAIRKNIIRIGPNQVAQIIWKLQLGGLEQLNGLRYIYPSQYPEEVWNVWTV